VHVASVHVVTHVHNVHAMYMFMLCYVHVHVVPSVHSVVNIMHM